MKLTRQIVDHMYKHVKCHASATLPEDGEIVLYNIDSEVVGD